MSLNIFRNHCKPQPQDFGIPPFEHVFPSLCKREWESLHPAFQHVARNYDMYSIRLMSSEKSAIALRKLYSEVLDRLARGEAFERLQAISANPSGVTHKTAKDRAKGREVLKDLLKGLKG